jgi:hypothetical protein
LGNTMTKQEIIDLILTHGSSSQKYIVKRDVLSVSIENPDMLELQDQILDSKPVKKILKNQNENGWFGVTIHGGFDAMDGAITQLRAFGVEPYHDFMQEAKRALYADEDPHKGRHPYPPVEEYHFSRAIVLACLHIDGEEPDDLLVKFQNHLIDKFERGSRVRSLDEVSREIRQARFQAKYPGCRAYLPGKDFPWVSDNSLIPNLSEAALRAIQVDHGSSGKWKGETQKEADIFFMVLLILHNARIDF